MQRASSRCGSKLFILVVLVVGALVESSAGQANIQGQWSTLSTPMPINPVHEWNEEKSSLRQSGLRSDGVLVHANKNG